MQVVWGYPGWGVVARVGGSEETVSQQKSLRSDVAFIDRNTGSVISNETAMNTLSPTEDKRIVPVGEIGLQYVFENGINTGASAHKTFGENPETKIRAGLGWSW